MFGNMLKSTFETMPGSMLFSNDNKKHVPMVKVKKTPKLSLRLSKSFIKNLAKAMISEDDLSVLKSNKQRVTSIIDYVRKALTEQKNTYTIQQKALITAYVRALMKTF
jgi:hypothetical protein